PIFNPGKRSNPLRCREITDRNSARSSSMIWSATYTASGTLIKQDERKRIEKAFEELQCCRGEPHRYSSRRSLSGRAATLSLSRPSHKTRIRVARALAEILGAVRSRRET